MDDLRTYVQLMTHVTLVTQEEEDFNDPVASNEKKGGDRELS